MTYIYKDRLGRDRVMVAFTTTYAISVHVYFKHWTQGQLSRMTLAFNLEPFHQLSQRNLNRYEKKLKSRTMMHLRHILTEMFR
jgi:hypothetical protein